LSSEQVAALTTQQLIASRQTLVSAYTRTQLSEMTSSQLGALFG
jgi:hypothetical protein